MPPQIVRIENAGSDTFRGKYDMAPWTVPPGGAAFAPYAAATTWLGDPALLDQPGLPRRSDEIMRLRVLYGLYHRPDVTRASFPQLEVFDASGAKLPMLVDVVFGGEQEAPANPMDAHAMMAEMQRQLEAMQALLNTRTDASAVSNVPGVDDAPSLFAPTTASPGDQADTDVTDDVPDDAPPTPGKIPSPAKRKG